MINCLLLSSVFLTCIIHQNTQKYYNTLLNNNLNQYFKEENFFKIECFLIYFHTASALRTY